MEKARLSIKYKNNRKKEYDIIFKVEMDDFNYLVYTFNEKENDILVVYAAKEKNGKISDIVKKDDINFINNIILNISKEEK